MIEARYHDSVHVLQEMFDNRTAFDDAPTPFDRAQWFALLAQTGLAPLIVSAENADGRAALALTEKNRRIEPLRNWYSFTWRQIGARGPQGDVLLAAIAQKLRGRAHRVTLAPVPEEDGSASALAKAFGNASWRVEVSRCDTNHALRVAGRSFAQYWAARPGRLRGTLKRKASKVNVVICDAFEPNAWQSFEDVYAASWKPSEGKAAMLRAFAEQEARARRLRLGLASHKGEPIAAQFWTVEGGVAYIHKLAHRECHRYLSPGTTLMAALFERVIDGDGVELIDFGTGDEPFKRDWMETTRPRYQIDCLDMRSARAWVDLARLALRRSWEAEVPALARVPLDS
ncbi:MAG: GNAT family N-acetyltransferase [Erythrobacter sp.]|uniref:GNAT family N-acetyltransferase n=1 Tax=Erythrobacter sp. TaxID=1042 RepID=UPI00263305BA|nr:GNAT family N-acetyltransferase [Erythrobacter sp.]MDJ0977859.1 GNAT family N-acetyltransferase [Erythrobacter sp.]